MGGGDAGGRRVELLGSWRTLAALTRVAAILVVVLLPLVLVLVVLLPLLSILKETREHREIKHSGPSSSHRGPFSGF